MTEPFSGEERNAPPSASFDPVPLARRLLRSVRTAALATIDLDGGGPHATLVTVATDIDGSPILLLSELSAHTANLRADPKGSLLMAATGKGDPLAHPRITLAGRFEPVQADGPDAGRIRRRFLARHPKAELYVDFADFAFRRLHVERAFLNGGFAKAATLPPGDILLPVDDPEAFSAAEVRAVAHINADHAHALALYAVRLAGAPDGRWEATGLDPDGIDLMAGDLTARVAFAERVVDPAGYRAALVTLAGSARAIG